MQILWKNAYEWDQPIPDELASSCNSFSTQLPSVSQVKIKRHIPIEQCTDVQLLGFSDASQKRYSAVVYMRLSYASKPGTVLLLKGRKVEGGTVKEQSSRRVTFHSKVGIMWGTAISSKTASCTTCIIVNHSHIIDSCMDRLYSGVVLANNSASYIQSIRHEQA